jgi:hypothetical protein
VVANQTVLVLPVRSAHGGDALPKRKKEVVAFRELLLGLLLQGGQFLAVGLSAGFQFGDSRVFLSALSIYVRTTVDGRQTMFELKKRNKDDIMIEQRSKRNMMGENCLSMLKFMV